MSEHRDYSTIFMQSDREMLKLLVEQNEQILKTLNAHFAFMRSAIRGIPGVIMPAYQAPDNLPNPPARGTMGGGFEANTGG